MLIDPVLRPVLCFWEHHLRQTVGLVMSSNRNFPVCPQNINRPKDFFVHILDQFFDRLLEDLAVFG